MTEFKFDTGYYFSSLDNLNRECRNYTNSEIKYKELIAKYENEIYNKALDDVWFAFTNEITLDSLRHSNKYEILAIIKRQIEQLKEQKE